MLTTVAVSGYRSLRDVVVPWHGLDVVTGANGSGKSNLYRALRLLAGCASGDIVAALAREGGLQSVLWAGPESLDGARKYGNPVQGTIRRGPISLRLGFAADDFGYLVDLGLPAQGPGAVSAFLRDPEIKREVVFSGPAMRPATVVARRRGQMVQVREGNRWQELSRGVAPWDSMIAEVADPVRTPELALVRRMLRRWRFHDGFRVDAHAPARRPQVGTRTLRLSDDGADLAAALQTLLEHVPQEVHRAVDDAFPGSMVAVDHRAGVFEVHLHQPGMLRPLTAAELSDGTLRYLLLMTALLTTDLPSLLVLNEPEGSLHPQLLDPLGRLIRRAAADSQIAVVTHSDRLAQILSDPDVTPAPGVTLPLSPPASVLALERDLGETRVVGLGRLTTPAWEWGSRR